MPNTAERELNNIVQIAALDAGLPLPDAGKIALAERAIHARKILDEFVKCRDDQKLAKLFPPHLIACCEKTLLQHGDYKTDTQINNSTPKRKGPKIIKVKFDIIGEPLPGDEKPKEKEEKNEDAE